MLTAVHLTRSANRRKILDDVCFDIKLGTTMTLLGPSGSGKTSLLRVIMGLDRIDGGELWLDRACLVGSNTFVAPEARNVSLVFQDFILFPHLNVIDNLVFGLKKPARDNRLITELLELLEIDRLTRRRIDRLSGGEQQRVALARALVVKPRVLLMDEPFSNIDCIMRDRLQERLLAWLKAAGTTTLIATHDHKEAFFFSDHILVMKDGRIIDQNPPRHIYGQPANEWVAGFFGETNFIEGDLLNALVARTRFAPQTRFLVRPESLLINGPGKGVRAHIRRVDYYGAYQDVHLALADGRGLLARASGDRRHAVGDEVDLGVPEHFDPHPMPLEGSANAGDETRKPCGAKP